MKKYVIFLFTLGCFLFLNSNVRAFDMAEKNGYIYNEEYVWEQFKNIENFNEENNKIFCSFTKSKSTGRLVSNFICYAFTEEQAKSLTYSNGSASDYWNLNFTSGTYYKVINTNHPFIGYIYSGSSIKDVTNYSSTNNYDHIVYTNFNISNATSELNSKINKLNFDEFIINLSFDENLFENDSNFKKVCVDGNFSITKKTTDGVLSESNHDFIWFPYGMSGIYKFNYSTEMEDGRYEFSDPYEHFYFSSYEEINNIWTTEYMQENFESKGYTDRYKYYGYTAYMFLHWYNFNEGNTYNFFPIFILDNATITHISSSDTSHGGGGLRLDGDEEIEINNEYCFYIKKEYEVNEVILDEWNDFNTSVDTPNGEINYDTSTNKDSIESESFLSQPIKFINEMKDTINFINALIYEFYISLPLLLRTFIITLLILLIVMLIMRIGGYK